MVYCNNCGEKLHDEACFCPKCGFKTQKGVDTAAMYPPGEIAEAFNRMGKELERAFNVASKEFQAAFQKARDNFNQKTSEAQGEAAVVCGNCGASNKTGAIFCRNCGNKLSTSK